MSNVYFIALTENCPDKVSAAARKLLETLVEKENIQLSDNIPLKVHFGEKFNRTYIKSENYAGIRDFLEEKKSPSVISKHLFSTAANGLNGRNI
jgi:uncharacterized Fe-S center protein